jgi:hypothetical protein
MELTPVGMVKVKLPAVENVVEEAVVVARATEGRSKAATTMNRRFFTDMRRFRM